MITRAVILIGVSRTQTLPKLQAVYDGIRGMQQWARSQGIPEELIKTITDEKDPVTPKQISDAVRSVVDRGDVEQLIIYFAGHGVNLRRGEYWLLSDAVDDVNAAVNVNGSVEIARYGAVPHVVFLSDACRTAPQGIQAQGITGSIIFPNSLVPGPARFVDQFLATLIGEPSLEIADPREAARVFRAVYTDVLLEALCGRHPDIAQPEGQERLPVVRPWPLQDFLAKELPLRVHQATQGANPRSQLPDAIINSRPNAWLSALPPPAGPLRFGPLDLYNSPPVDPSAREHGAFAEAEGIRPLAAMRIALDDERVQLDNLLASLPSATSVTIPKTNRRDLDLFSNRNRQFAEDIQRNAQPFGTMHFESACGFKVRGTKVVSCEGRAIQSTLLDDGSLVRIDLQTVQCASVLLTLANGQGVLLPAIQDFLGTLTFDGQPLIDVAYEPSSNSSRWADFQQRADELRTLRAVVAASSRQGIFRLKGTEGDKLARRMQFAKSIDPSLALYAAHAYREQGNRQRIEEMAHFMQQDLGICLYDIALLAGKIHDLSDLRGSLSIYPFLPLLAQSWALLPAYDVQLPPLLKDIRRYLSTDSLWTLYDAPAVALLSQWMHEGNVR